MKLSEDITTARELVISKLHLAVKKYVGQERNASSSIFPIAKTILISAAVVAGLSIYLYIASIQNEVNRDPGKSDQHAYINIAKEAYASRFAYTGDRNRTPLFPWITALIFSPDMSDEEFFERGKRLNVVISLMGLSMLGLAFFYRFAKLYAIYSMMVIAFLFFSIKAPFFQAEILFFVIFSLAFILSIESILHPKWYKSAGLGLLFALAHFTKASVLPGLAIFTTCFAVPILGGGYLRHRLNCQRLLWIVFHALAPLFLFVVALSPYFNESKERYGHYLYNVTTTFYLWYDTWAVAKAGTMAAGDHEGWPDLPNEEIPSLSKYLAEHSPVEIFQRIQFGAERTLYRACTYTNSHSRLGYCGHVGAGLLILFGCLAFRTSRPRSEITLTHVHISLYLTFFFLVYLIFSFWAWTITTGPRVALMLLIPLYWTIGLLLESTGIKSLNIVIIRRRIQLWHVVYLVLIAIMLFQVYELVAFRAATLYGGK